MNCPTCGNAWGLYKELLPDGKVIICCFAGKCNYRSQPMERHDAEKLGLKKISEVKKEWNGT
jgi:hypothetical protein